MEHIILVNPVSGNHKGRKKGVLIQKLLKKNGIDSIIYTSEYPGHLTEIAKDLSSKHTCRFYCVGGDGTLNEVITGMIGTDSEIVVIPSGTGNDFIKSISKYYGMRKIVLESINRKSSKIDVLKVNKDKYCINILNSGFDAMVAKNVDNFRIFRFLTGKMKYNLAIFYTLLANRNYKFKIRYGNDKILKGYFTLAVVANGKYYGGGICPCPDANVEDGFSDLCIVDSTTITNKILLLSKYKKGEHIGHKKVNIDKSDKVSIVSTRKFPFSIDGEVLYTNKLYIKVLHEAVNIVVID